MNASEIRAAYARELKEQIGIRRYTGAGANRPRFDVYVRGKATPYATTELIGTISAGRSARLAARAGYHHRTDASSSHLD
jgi:hypothetical protein